MSEATTVGKRGTVVIPARLRKRLSIHEGDAVLMEEHEGGVLVRPAITLPIEIYTPERKAEFLLGSAMTAADYAWAQAEVRRLGLDPGTIPHQQPPRR
jgi:AbrB family looped-hinge helix DNA binding protein